MRISGRQLAGVIRERLGRFERLHAADFLKTFVTALDERCRLKLPCLDEPLVRQGSWANGDSVDLNYCRPTVGRGIDVSWRIVIEADVIKVQVVTGDFGVCPLADAHGGLAALLPTIASVCVAVDQANKHLRVYLDGVALPIDKLRQCLGRSSAVRIEGNPVQLMSEIRVDLQREDVNDVGAWCDRAMEMLSPVYLVMAPRLSAWGGPTSWLEENEYSEGAINYRVHRAIERDPAVIAEAKELFKACNNGRLFCEVCGFDFFARYGDRGRDFAEGHHTRPVSQMVPGDYTRPTEICIVCSNCHSMLHRGTLMTPSELRRVVLSRLATQ